jgi:Domain of unknown function (DUF4190)
MTEPARTYALRWKGRQSGPFSLERIHEMLAANEISLMHQIEVNGGWRVLDEYLSDQRRRTTSNAQPTPPDTQLAPRSAEAQAPEPVAADYVEGEFVKVSSTRRSRLSPLAVASLVMAACNFIPYVNFGAWLLSLLFGHLALAQMKRDESLEGRGLAIAGLVITYFVVLMALTFMVLMLASRQPLPFFSSGR